MKITFLLVVAVLLVTVVNSSKKGRKEYEGKSKTWSGKQSHNVKKYSGDQQSHHDKRKKTHYHENLHKNEIHGSEPLIENKEAKEIPNDEAPRKDLKANKKSSLDHHSDVKHSDLHLQDLNHPYESSEFRQDGQRNQHNNPRGHHKRNQESSSHKAEKPHNQKEKGNVKLFADSDPKEKELKQSHSVLENSFEKVNHEAVKEDVKEGLKEDPQEIQSKEKVSKKKSNKKAHEKAEKGKSQKNTKQNKGKKEKKYSKS